MHFLDSAKFVATPEERADIAECLIRIYEKHSRSTERRFDDCFEMGDGDSAVKHLVNSAKKQPWLMSCLPKYINRESIRKELNQ